MKKLARRISKAVQNSIESRVRQMRRKLLEQEFSATFQRLEPRRVLSATAVFDPSGLLQIEFSGDTSGDSVVLREDPGDSNYFLLDINGNGIFDLGDDVRELKVDLTAIEVLSPGGGGVFTWQDNFSASPIDQLTIDGVQQTSLNSIATIGDGAPGIDSSVSVIDTISIGGNLDFRNSASFHATDAIGSIVTTNGSTLRVADLASFEANTITLGTASGDTVHFGELHFESGGNVTLHLDSSVLLVDSAGQPNSALNLDLRVQGDIELISGAHIETSENLLLQTEGNDSDIQIFGEVRAHGDSLTLRSDDSIEIGSGGSLLATKADALIELFGNANGDAAGDDFGHITMSGTAQIAATSGRVEMTTLGVATTGVGNITLTDVLAGDSGDQAIQIHAWGSLYAAAPGLTPNLSTPGAIRLSSANGVIGTSGGGEVRIDADRSQFQATGTAPGAGSVFITDIPGALPPNGLNVFDVSHASGGGRLVVQSPLEISADITTGASMVFVAGNDAVAIDDNITISNNATVTLNGASSTLTFEAGDHILFASGRIVTDTGTGNRVILSANRDGGADGEIGSIYQSPSGAGVIEVETDVLEVYAGAGVRLEVQVASLSGLNTGEGAIYIFESDAIELTNVINQNGDVQIFAGGDIDAIYVQALSPFGFSNDIELTSFTGSITLHSVLADLDFGDVTISASGAILDGDTSPDDMDVRGRTIYLESSFSSIGSVTDDIFCGDANPIEIVASGTISAFATNGMIALDIPSNGDVVFDASTVWIQSEGNIDASTLSGISGVTNLALIADVDKDGTGTLTWSTPLTVSGDLRLEGNAILELGPVVTATRLLVISDLNVTLNVDVEQLDVTSGGAIFINQVSTRTLELIDLNCDEIAIQTIDYGGPTSSYIYIESSGSMIVSDAVIAGNDGRDDSGGFVYLFSTDVSGQIDINDLVQTDLHSVFVYAYGSIHIGITESPNDTDASTPEDLATGLYITTISGNIYLYADLDGNGSGGIEMSDDSQAIAGRAPGATPVLGSVGFGAAEAEIYLYAYDDITLSSLQTTNKSSNAIWVVSENGGIVDAGESALNLVANRTGAQVTLNARLGIGSTNPLETNVDQLIAINDSSIAGPASGAIRIHETASGGNLILAELRNTAALGAGGEGSAVVTVSDGHLYVEGPVSVEGNIRLDASDDVVLNQGVHSVSGNISIRAGDDIYSNFTIEAALTIDLVAENDQDDGVGNDGIVMGPSSVVTAQGNIRMFADNDGDILLGAVVTPSDVSLIADRSIFNNIDRGVDPVTNNITATHLQMIAVDGSIGTSDLLAPNDVNRNAIYTDVARVVAQSSTGIYIREANAIIVGLVDPIRVNRVHADGDTSEIEDTGPLGLETTLNGSIKLQSVGGNIDIYEPVRAHGAGDLLLQTLLVGAIRIYDSVHADSGAISIRAVGDIVVDAEIETTSGAGGAIGLASGSDIHLGRISTPGNVYLTAGNSILRSSSHSINISADHLEMQAWGTIGENDPGAGELDINSNSIRTDVRLLSARSSQGIYVYNEGDLTIANSRDFDFTQVYFNSTRTAGTAPSLDGLETTLNGEIKIQNGTGALTVEAPSLSPGAMVRTGLSGDVVLQTLDEGDILVGGGVQTKVGNIRIDGVDDIYINAKVEVVETGTVRVFARNEVSEPSFDGVLMTSPGEIKTAGGHITVESGGNAGSILLTSIDAGDGGLLGDVALRATGSIDEVAASSRVEANHLILDAGSYAHLKGASATYLTANVTSNHTLAGWQVINGNAANKGEEFIGYLRDDNGLESEFSLPPVDKTIDLQEYNAPGSRYNPEHYNFDARYGSDGYALYVVNDRELHVLNVDAGASSAPNIYIETTGNNALSVHGVVETLSTDSNEGGIVLVAGETLHLVNGSLLNISYLGDSQIIFGESFGDQISPMIPPTNIVTRFYHGGTGVGGVLTTRDVLSETGIGPPTDNLHYFQQVVAQYGVAGERGFIVFIGYADKQVQIFDTQLDIDTHPLVGGGGNIQAYPVGGGNPGANFIREIFMLDDFYDEHRNLPTEMIIRRGEDFFLFENANSAVVDRSYEMSKILDVYTAGGRIPASPPPLPDPEVRIVSFTPEYVPPEIAQRIDFMPPPSIELNYVAAPGARVEVYRVDYLDQNHDGQPDLNELPEANAIRDAVDDSSVEKKPELIHIPKEAMPDLRTGTITAEDIEKIRQALLKDPTTPSGAYSIILRTPDQKIIIVDVFPVRDFPEADSDQEEIMIEVREGVYEDIPEGLLPAPVVPPDRGASYQPSSLREDEAISHLEDSWIPPRSTSAAFLLSALWLSSRKEKEETSHEPSSSIGYSSNDRRRRRLHNQLQTSKGSGRGAF